jgi:hypothetical protein
MPLARSIKESGTNHAVQDQDPDRHGGSGEHRGPEKERPEAIREKGGAIVRREGRFIRPCGRLTDSDLDRLA